MPIRLCHINSQNNQHRPYARCNIRYSMSDQPICNESKNHLEVDHMHSIAMSFIRKLCCQKILLKPLKSVPIHISGILYYH